MGSERRVLIRRTGTDDGEGPRPTAGAFTVPAFPGARPHPIPVPAGGASAQLTRPGPSRRPRWAVFVAAVRDVLPASSPFDTGNVTE